MKFRSHLSRGVTVGTMLQDEAFHFMRIGSFLERADNTARLLDVKFHAADRRVPRRGAGARDRASKRGVRLLSLVGDPALGVGFEVYRKAYRNVILPERVAELLILARHAALAGRPHAGVVGNLRRWPTSRAARRCAPAGRLRADLQYGRIDEILATGLHAFLTQFLDRVNTIGVGISRDFLVPCRCSSRTDAREGSDGTA